MLFLFLENIKHMCIKKKMQFRSASVRGRGPRQTESMHEITCNYGVSPFPSTSCFEEGSMKCFDPCKRATLPQALALEPPGPSVSHRVPEPRTTDAVVIMLAKGLRRDARLPVDCMAVADGCRPRRAAVLCCTVQIDHLILSDAR